MNSVDAQEGNKVETPNITNKDNNRINKITISELLVSSNENTISEPLVQASI